MGSLLSTPKATATEAQDNDKRNQITPKRRRRMSATGASSDGVAALRSAKRARTDSSSLAAEQTTRDPVNLSSNNATAPPVRRRKRKVALMLGYIGERYYGMQMNVGVLTIEKVLFDALRQAGAISDENKNSLGRVNWMRAARTDKGVSAASQCVSAKIHCEVNGQIDRRLVDQINSYLPEDVHLFGILRATSAFNARSDCHRRRYEYIFPLRLLGGKSTVEASEGSEPGDPRVAKLNEILAAYVGTHCFANFTEGLAGSDDSAKRYMIEVKCSQPFLPSGSGVYYVSICIFGQSFVLHQIRKMIGLALFVYLGRVSAKVIPVALSPHVRIPTPTAPSLGLLLDELYFDQYNTRHKSALPVPISMKCFAKEKFDFKLSKIYARIAEKERLNRTMENWIRSSLNRQKYDAEKVDELHKDFVLSDNGLEAQRKARIASLYPIVTNLESLASPQGSAWEVDTFQLANTMRTEFEARFGTPASFLVRAPGRVILIGEHVDYNDLPVIGVALSQSTLIAGCWDAAAKLEIEHFEANAFLKGSLHSDGARLADTVQAQENERGMDDKWLNYVSCGIKAMVSDLKLNKRTEPTGGRILVGGNLPRAFGLSSSSSLVTAAALSAARLNRKRVPKHSVTETAANGERLGAGTQGGAVDHALCMGGVKGSALYVSFNPKPSTIPLTLPTQVVFVVVNSNVVAEKGLQGGAALHYNTRVAECRIASAILARRLKTILPNVVQTVGQLLHMAMRTKGLKIESLSDLRERVAAVMAADEKMNVKDVLAEMKIPESEVRSRFLGHLPLEEFELGKRISHVLSEAERVERFKSILEGDTASDAVVDQIGQILDESHKSLKEKYQCSCDEVDAVVSFCKENGSSGSRVTGAGWGGCVLSVVHMSKLEPFLNATRRRYGNSSVFAVSPASGASIFAIHSSYSNPRVS